jgi:hypothetical protein
MRSGRLGLAAIVAATLSAGLCPSPSVATGVTPGGLATPAPSLRAGPVVFHAHSKRAISSYCYERNYWWFYRPYGNGKENHARCMHYFHYPPGAYGRAGPGEVK